MTVPSQPQRFPIPAFHDCRQDVARLHELRDTLARRTKKHVVPRPLLNHPAVVVHDDPLSECIDVGQVVRHDQHRDIPAFLHLRQFLAQGTAQGRVKRRERLIEQQQARLHGQGTGQRHALLLTAGELPRPALGQRLQVEIIQQLRNPLPPFLPRQSSQPEADVVGNAQMREQRVVLRHVSDAAFLGRKIQAAGTVEDGLAVERDMSRVGLNGSGNGLERQALARSRGAEQRDQSARRCEGRVQLKIP